MAATRVTFPSGVVLEGEGIEFRKTLESLGIEEIDDGVHYASASKGIVAFKAFVIDEMGANFKTGRGFYQFTKRETVQENKEVILVDKVTGDMWTSPEARDMIGIPLGTRGKVSPVDLPYDVYIQSTSHNRKLKAGTKFLYEAPEFHVGA